MINIAFLKVSVEPRRGSRLLLGMHISAPDAQGRGVGGKVNLPQLPIPKPNLSGI